MNFSRIPGLQVSERQVFWRLPDDTHRDGWDRAWANMVLLQTRLVWLNGSGMELFIAELET
jgi:hypothetical protein